MNHKQEFSQQNNKNFTFSESTKGRTNIRMFYISEVTRGTFVAGHGHPQRPPCNKRNNVNNNFDRGFACLNTKLRYFCCLSLN